MQRYATRYSVMRIVALLSLISFHAFSQGDQDLRFIENKGQWDKKHDFQARVPGGRLGVSATGFSILLLDMEELEHRHLESHGKIEESSGHGTDAPIDGHYFQINLLGSNPNTKPIAETPLEGYDNYFLGADSRQWVRKAMAYATVLYPDVYPGIDFRVSSLGTNLKYDFIVRPGADPSQIRLQYDGTFGVEQEEDALVIKTAVGSLTEEKPYCYQANGKANETVPSAYTLNNDIVSFRFPADYDASRTLVIDPLLIFSTYSGSTADNWGSTATPGEHGTLYSAGITRVLNGVGFFPATTGAYQTTNKGGFDMAIIKYDSAGTKFLYATHLGGSGNDSPQSLVVDEVSGDLLVLGISSSDNFPTSAGGYDKTFNFGTEVLNGVLNTRDKWDIVITRFSPDGTQLIGSTFLGGTDNDGLNISKARGGPLVVNYGDEMRGDIMTDAAGNVYIASVTSSSDFPVPGGFDQSYNGGLSDGVVTKLAPDLSSILWSTYIGGAGTDAAYSLKFDKAKNIVLGGGTSSADFPATPGAYQATFNGIVDGWIARLSADGSNLMQATFTGTTSFDQVYFVDLNEEGDVFCYGQTAGHMPVTANVFNNPNSGQFLQRFSPDLSTRKFSTIFGSASPSGLVIPNISPTAFLVNACDNIYMAGWGGDINSTAGYWQSNTNGMTVTPDAQQPATTGSDFYFIVLNGDATELVYSTYLGGTSSKTHVDGGTSRFDKHGIVYHAVCSGCTSGNSAGPRPTSDFPTTLNAKSRVNRSNNCNNAAFKFDLSTLRANFDTNNLDLTMPGYNNVCFPEQILFQNLSTGGKTFIWDFDDGTIVTRQKNEPRNVIHQFNEEGDYHVKLKINDLSTCAQSDSITKVIHYFKPNIFVGDDGKVCTGQSFQLTASGGETYTWTSEDGTFTSDAPSPVVTPANAMTYYVTVVDDDGCTKSDTVYVNLIPYVYARFETYDVNLDHPGYNEICAPDVIQLKNLSENGKHFVWTFNDGTVPLATDDMAPFVHGFERPGTYNIKLKAVNENTCNKADSIIKTIRYYREQIEVGPGGEICEGTTFRLTASGGNVYTWTAADGTFTSPGASPTVQPKQSTRYYLTATDPHGCVGKDTVDVFVEDRVTLHWEHQLLANCVGRPSLSVENLTPPAEDVAFLFDFGDGFQSADTKINHVYENDGVYTIKLSARKKICYAEETVQFPFYSLRIPNMFTPEGSPGYNDRFEIGFGGDMLDPAGIGLPVHLSVFDRWGRKVFESSDYKNDWDGHNVVGGVYFIHVQVGDMASCKNWLHIMK
ncbi:DUF7948 domain-containing protein [Parachryseolinea silvisoli]|uniref:DUF7948 domain-containing protein n=1 Tax=Parachryseolinea silvisoli TaxID=2873601 RepID=UPI002265A496|nr:PKD domain-containing protein [Parachryseolinea silvisoli]MCD9018893.1 gliding motility-associated C-terminal domain-containing protein [Parachryseolinea silvisoli]